MSWSNLTQADSDEEEFWSWKSARNPERCETCKFAGHENVKLYGLDETIQRNMLRSEFLGELKFGEDLLYESKRHRIQTHGINTHFWLEPYHWEVCLTQSGVEVVQNRDNFVN